MSDKTILASLDKVEVQIREIQIDYSYRLTEYSIGELIKKFRQKEDALDETQEEEMSILVVPKYQRDFIWPSLMQSRFIESIFMGVPIQPLFAFELDEEGNLELLDGVQRLSTINEFVNNKLILDSLEEIDTLNHYTFGQLEASRRRKFLNSTLKVYIINEKTDEGIRADIFRRLNETGKKLESAEIRKGKFINNAFYDFILECTETPEFAKLFSTAKNKTKLRGEKEELVTRFFAYSDNYTKFEHSVKNFLDGYIITQGETFNPSIKEKKTLEFKGMLEFITQHIPNGFRKTEGSKSIPRVRFEALSIGVNLALRIKPDLSPVNVDWINSKEFRIITTSDAANNKSKVTGRIEFVRDCLLGEKDITSLSYDN